MSNCRLLDYTTLADYQLMEQLKQILIRFCNQDLLKLHNLIEGIRRMLRQNVDIHIHQVPTQKATLLRLFHQIIPFSICLNQLICEKSKCTIWSRKIIQNTCFASTGIDFFFRPKLNRKIQSWMTYRFILKWAKVDVVQRIKFTHVY